ncbi:hypothetical protein M408DRAFT_120522 [Serendipita vermifera MAFF 305830]|uniref:DNA-directed RNA polymerase I subunit RPA49 n=1 Tax=Serendipita vermifera MAFF 305830 TaxID=933852 RepID=A0A0C3BAT1_SERVB|nr:hypothetical protein M408DRAFT_120522 [Serendipita vermifera MAFF 305830]
MAAINSKKRKRDDDDDELLDQHSARIAVSTSSPFCSGPALAVFPSILPLQDTGFSPYSNETEAVDFASAKTLIAGETDAVQFISTNRDKVEPGYNCQYLIGIRDKTTNKMTIRTAPLFLISHHVKALESLSAGTGNDRQEYIKAKNQLGEAFGTKKARAAIRAAERNKVDVGALGSGVQDVLQDMIQSKTSTLPQKEDAERTADDNRLVPRYNAGAVSPAEVYPLEFIISDAELKTISLDRTALGSLPFRRSTWINDNVKRRTSEKPAKAERLELKMLYYISAMFLFRKIVFKSVERSELRDKLQTLPEVIADSLISRFTETTRGSTRVLSTPQKETELLTHALALCLRVDHFATDHKIIAADLGMPQSTLQVLFKSLGCVIAVPSRGEQVEAGLNQEQAKDNKLAILRVPLKFPAPPRRR